MDTISDFLTRIRNANMRKHPSVSMPSAKICTHIAYVMKEEGFISAWQVTSNEKKQPTIDISLKYDSDGSSVIRNLKRVSCPSLRTYKGWREIDRVYNGQGIAIVSTSKGVLSDYQCRKQKLGGEVLCEVW